MKKTIAVLEGDGIGPEIVGEGIKVLKAVEQQYGHTFHLDYAPFGAQAYFTHGSPFPEQTQHICDHADAIIKGLAAFSAHSVLCPRHVLARTKAMWKRPTARPRILPDRILRTRIP